MTGSRRIAALVATTWLALAELACSPGRRDAAEGVFPWVDAVQTQDFELMKCLWAGPPPGADFEGWIRSSYDAYERERAEGQVALREDGVALIKAFGLGTGTNLGILEVFPEGPDGIAADTLATFNYEQIDGASLPVGSRFWVSLAPPGKVAEIAVPSEPGEQSLDVLKSVKLRWHLRRIEPRGRCRSPWGFVSVAPVPGSETTVRATWRF